MGYGIGLPGVHSDTMRMRLSTICVVILESHITTSDKNVESFEMNLETYL